MKQYISAKMLTIILLGIASGLPLTLSASTLSLMLIENGIDIAKISLFGLAATPYALKYLWSPLVDNLQIPFLHKIVGHRRSWLFLIQICLAASIIFVGNGYQNDCSLLVLGAGVLSIAFFSATQDIIIDAYRIEILSDEEQGYGAAAITFGYRMGMLISSVGCLYIAEFFNWQMAYGIMSLVLIPGAVAALLYGEPVSRLKKAKSISRWLMHAFVEPFTAFIRKANWVWILALILFYKLSDAYIGMMTNPFLVEVGFSKIEIANIIKGFGFCTTIIGMYIGGYIISKWQNINKVMLVGLILQAVSNLLFIVQYYAGYDVPILMVVISAENFCSGISNAALVAYISLVINKEFTATHYALLSSFAVMGRSTISASAGAVVVSIGWPQFFILSAVLSLPALICIYKLKQSAIKA